jgi:hypothetical protein
MLKATADKGFSVFNEKGKRKFTRFLSAYKNRKNQPLILHAPHTETVIFVCV